MFYYLLTGSWKGLLMLIAMAGLPGTGKSTLAHHMAHALAAIVLDKDVIRAALFPPAWVEYTTEQDDFCMSVMFQVSAYVLRKDPHQYVILDGRTFSRHYQVMALKRFAEELQTPLRIIECVCSDETARQRLEKAASGKERHLAKNRDYTLYLEMKAHFEPINEPKLVVNTDEDLARCLDMCLPYVKKGIS
jgi:predicted kinase